MSCDEDMPAYKLETDWRINSKSHILRQELVQSFILTCIKQTTTLPKLISSLATVYEFTFRKKSNHFKKILDFGISIGKGCAWLLVNISNENSVFILHFSCSNSSHMTYYSFHCWSLPLHCLLWKTEDTAFVISLHATQQNICWQFFNPFTNSGLHHNYF